MFNVNSFSISRLPKIEFGPGTINKLPSIIKTYGNRLLIVTGDKSFIQSESWADLEKNLSSSDIEYTLCHVITEPSPTLIDKLVQDYRLSAVDAVVAIGGGSALDAGKAIAGLLKTSYSVMDFLEGVGPELVYEGPVVPFIAVPTTAGTGSEATKNAVLSEQSFNGYKKSFRDEKLVPAVAIVDPDLLKSCPESLIAANGMDALTQLMESYVSTHSNEMTDALAISGIKAIKASLLAWYDGDNSDTNRSKMAYASLLSGINLAQTGLGSVHGLASPLGAFFPIPHGMVCGTLLAEAADINITAMKQREPDNPALFKYAELGRLLSDNISLNDEAAHQSLIFVLRQLVEQMDLPYLKEYGIRVEHLEHIVGHSRGSSMKTNPIVLTDDEIRQLVFRRIKRQAND
ncbi:MAG: iron-containing alcohol dehydrogenase [Gammaproteobacteria bacterium]|nr:iron-containing alcohol dehydrogenase [Gammaproteobacteria bacterium]